MDSGDEVKQNKEAMDGVEEENNKSDGSATNADGEETCQLMKGDSDVNSNVLKAESNVTEVSNEKETVVKSSEGAEDVKWKKTTSSVKKRKYRLRSSAKEDEQEADGSEGCEEEASTGTEKHDDNSETETKDKTPNGESAENQDKPQTSSLKRTKVKSHRSSAERKKGKKASSNKNGDGESTSRQITDNDGQQETAETNVETNIESTDNKDSDDSSSDSETLSHSSSSSSHSPEHNPESERQREPLTDDEVWLEKHTSKIGLPTWNAVEELWKRERGCGKSTWQLKVCGSHAMVRKFQQQFTLDAHEGCVNALHFNQTGTMLASGSDDLDIHIWEWMSSSSEPFISYNSGHRSNVFQTKFMPNSNDLTVISCARDGQVRVGYLSSTGSCRDTKKIAQHRGSAHKLALDSAGCRSTFLSCGEDSVVMFFDLRENKPANKLVTVKSGSDKVALYSIDTSPKQPSEFGVSGRDQWARVYDRRMLDPENPETVAKYCPHHLQNASDMKANITCLVYNYNGSELLCSYNDEDIYLFNTTHSSGDDFARKYKGHRNNATVKGVNFYGPRSEFVVSGSDCGNIFLWDKASSKVVQFMQGDEGGVVNVLEPHPNLPILATSGLDKNIKIWGPTGDGVLEEEDLKKLMLLNRQERHDESSENNVIDSHLLWFLMRSLRNARSRRRREDGNDDSSNTSSSVSSSDSDEEDPSASRRMDCLTS